MQINESSIRLRNLIISLAIFVALALYAATYAEPVLRVSVMPGESPPVLRRKLKPLTDYLEKRVGMKMEFRPMLNDDALVDALLNHKLDLVWIDGINLSRAKTRSNGRVIALVQREEEENTRSGLIATSDNNGYTWTVRADMDANLRQKMTEAFLSLNRNNGQGREILDLQHARRFIPVRAEYHSVTQAPLAQP
jgi:ABC-type phosphate/phosphonate transport system substrate-binding protein